MTAPEPTATRVLVVEDNPFIAMEVQDTLCDAGFAVTLASTLEDGLEAIENADYDCALVDYKLAEETCEPIAAALRSRSVPFALTTGVDSAELQGEALGAARALTKPYTTADVVEAVRALA